MKSFIQQVEDHTISPKTAHPGTSRDQSVWCFGWRRIPSPPYDPVPYYHLAMPLPDGRKFWRLWINARKSPDEFLLALLRASRKDLASWVAAFSGSSCSFPFGFGGWVEIGPQPTFISNPDGGIKS